MIRYCMWSLKKRELFCNNVYNIIRCYGRIIYKMKENLILFVEIIENVEMFRSKLFFRLEF